MFYDVCIYIFYILTILTMKKQLYQLAIGFLGLFSVVSIQAQITPCENAFMTPGVNLSSSNFNNEYQKCDNHSPFELQAISRAETQLYFHWFTKGGKFLSQGPTFNNDTTGEFYLEVEGGGCLKEFPFIISNSPEIILYSSATEYCKDSDKPTVNVNIIEPATSPNLSNIYTLVRDNQFVATILGTYTLENASAGTYTIVTDFQGCMPFVPTITITEKECTSKVCEPTSDSIYDATLENNIYKSCDVAGWKLNYPNNQQPEGIEITWKKNGDVIESDIIELSMNIEITLDIFSVEATGKGCSWTKEIEIIRDSINAEITTSDANYRHCPENPIVIAAKGNNHIAGEEYIWEKKDNNGLYQFHGKGEILPNPSFGMFRMYVKTSRGCFSSPTEFPINEGDCNTTCNKQIKVKKINNNPIIGISPFQDSTHFYICDQEVLGLEAFVYPTTTGSITWYNVTSSPENNVGGNPLYVGLGLAGKYIARYQDGNCIVNSDTISVDYAIVSPIEILAYDGVDELEIKNKSILICPSQSVTLKPNIYYYTNYLWEKNNVFISNDIEAFAENEGYYTVSAMDPSGCYTQDYLTINVNHTPNCIVSGIENEHNQSIQLSPNPVASSLYIRGLEVSTVQVVSPLGKISTEQVFNGEINLENYPAGVYTILLIKNGKSEAHRIVKR